jgi:hypothetical protein
MKQTAPLKATVLALSGILALAISCRDDENRLTVQDTVDISEEATVDAYYQDVDDMAGVTLSTSTDDQYSGRIATTITVQDSRFKCSGIVVTITPSATSTKTNPQGVITVDFGTGCTDLAGNVRAGKLIFTYTGWRFQPGSTVVTTTDNYTINGIKLTGTRTLTNVSGSTTAAPRFNAVLANGVATFPDGRTATRESNLTWSWVKGESPGGINDQLIIDQSSTASGTTRAGRSYTVSLQKELVYTRYCGIAVSGIKKYELDGGKEIIIDYGNGTCDKNITVTVNGTTRNLSI